VLTISSVSPAQIKAVREDKNEKRIDNDADYRFGFDRGLALFPAGFLERVDRLSEIFVYRFADRRRRRFIWNVRIFHQTVFRETDINKKFQVINKSLIITQNILPEF
jgi:hypothetical protein